MRLLILSNQGKREKMNQTYIFIGPRYPWSDLWVLISETGTHFADLTDVTLADEDTNSILTDNSNREIQGNVAMQVMQPGDQCKLCHLVIMPIGAMWQCK